MNSEFCNKIKKLNFLYFEGKDEQPPIVDNVCQCWLACCNSLKGKQKKFTQVQCGMANLDRKKWWGPRVPSVNFVSEACGCGRARANAKGTMDCPSNKSIVRDLRGLVWKRPWQLSCQQVIVVHCAIASACVSRRAAGFG